jgi:hypothetical protein
VRRRNATMKAKASALAAGAIGLPKKKDGDKVYRGIASQFFVAGELCRRGYSAAVTMGNTPDVDILCSNRGATKFVHIQVKTFVPGNKSCPVGKKAEETYDTTFFWVLAGIPPPESKDPFIYYIIPAAVMASHVAPDYADWLKTPGKRGQKRNDNKVRRVRLPHEDDHWDEWLSDFKDEKGWELIDKALGKGCRAP